MAKGWCQGHYVRWKRTGDPAAPGRIIKAGTPCMEEGCERQSHARGYCAMHYARLRKLGGTQIKLTNSGKPALTPEQSQERASRVLAEYESGASLTDLALKYDVSAQTISRTVVRSGGRLRTRAEYAPRGDAHPKWKGGRRQTPNGYVVVLTPEGYLPEHRLVMAEHVGRPLEPWETVHHINGDRSDNRLENLQLRSGQHGPYQAIGCMDCGSHRIGPVKIADAPPEWIDWTLV